MKTGHLILLSLGVLAAGSAMAQMPFPVPNPGGSRSGDYMQGYRDGYRDGFERGRQEAMNNNPGWNSNGNRFGDRSGPDYNPFGGGSSAPGGRSINVVSAVYGNYSSDCDATRYVASRAAGRMVATIEVSNNMCGDPARGDRKTLRVRYYCGSELREASAPEHRSVTLDCTVMR